MLFLSIYVNLSKMAGVFIFSCFLVVVLNGGYPLGVARGVKGVYFSIWELLVVSCLQKAIKKLKFKIFHFQKCMPDKKNDMLIFTFPKTCSHFQNGFRNELSFSKCGSFLKCAFIFKMWFFLVMCFHFQNVKGFVSVVFPFSEKHNCKQKSVHSLQIALLMRL